MAMTFFRLGCLVTMLTACSPAATVKPADKPVPANLAVPAGNALLLKASAKGVQIYTCKPEGWVLKAPEAELFDEEGRKIGHHSGGPTWELADGGAVIGEVKEKAPADGTIPWLLLAKKSTRGEGAFSRVTFIQRLETQGGKAPADGCDAGHQGAEVRVDYTASYSFYAAQ
jgi:Protein of unknown function (DUF3455)